VKGGAEVMRTTIRSRRWLIVAAIAVLTLFGTACSSGGTTQKSEVDDPQSQQLAGELQQKLKAEGLPVPATQTLTQLYGTDGGVTCTTAESEFQTFNSAVGFGSASGRRPVIIDPQVLKYDAAVLSVYCPDVLSEFQELVKGWQTAATIPGS
jgi:hypothetical protein